MKVSFNRGIINGPYGGGNHVLSFLVEYFTDSGIEVSYSLDEDTRFIFLMDVRDRQCTFPLKKAIEHKKKFGSRIVHRFNENDAHRHPSKNLGLDSMHIIANKNADYSVFVSSYLESYFKSLGLEPKNSRVIWNCSDRRIFNSEGCEIRKPSDPIRVVTHHWSNNLYKGFPVYKKVQDFCNSNPSIANFKFMGRKLKGYIYDQNHISPKTHKEIPSFLKNNDIYLTASIAEPGGNHIMEGFSCGLIPFVGSNTGSCVEYTNGANFIFNDVKDILDKLTSLHEDYDEYLEAKRKAINFSKNTLPSAEDMAKEYTRIFYEY
jgi:hypothetical protein